MTDLVNGTTLDVSAALPASFNAAGYNALTFVTVGNIIDMGEIGKAYNAIAHQVVGKRYPEKLKGNYDIGNLTITLGKVIADAGQVIIAAGLAADTSYSFKITLPSGNTGQITGKVLKAARGGIAADGVETLVVDIAIDPESLVEA